MAQYGDMDQKIAGLKYGIAESRDESWVVADAEGIPFGYPVFGYRGDPNNAYRFHNDQDTVVFDDDFVTGNNIDGSVNGDAITQVPFDTDQDTTIANLVAAIQALDADYIVELTDTGGNNRTIRIVTPGETAVSAFTVTGGASQAVAAITSAFSAELEYLGAARHEHKEPETQGTNSATWELGDTINVMAQGQLYAEVGEAVNANTDAYVLVSGGNIGKYGNNSGSDFATDSRFRETLTAAGLARLYIGGENG